MTKRLLFVSTLADDRKCDRERSFARELAGVSSVRRARSERQLSQLDTCTDSDALFESATSKYLRHVISLRSLYCDEMTDHHLLHRRALDHLRQSLAKCRAAPIFPHPPLHRLTEARHDDHSSSPAVAERDDASWRVERERRCSRLPKSNPFLLRRRRPVRSNENEIARRVVIAPISYWRNEDVSEARRRRDRTDR